MAKITKTWTNIADATTSVSGWMSAADKTAHDRLVQIPTATGEPTGFEDPDNIGIAYDSSARTFTLTHSSGTIAFWSKGTRFTKTSPQVSSAHTNTTGNIYWLYYNSSGDLAWEAPNTFPGMTECLVAYANFGASDKFGLRECHGLMPWQAHQEFHSQIGTYRKSGGLVPAGSWAANTNTVAAVTPAVDSAVIADEDLATTIAALTDGSTYTRVHFISNVAVFTTGSTFPYPNNGTDLQYNPGGTTLTAITTNNNWMNIYAVFVPVTSDSASQAYRILWITGQAIYSSLSAAQSEEFRSINTGDLTSLFTEMIPYIRVTYRRDSTYTNTVRARLETGAITYLVGNRQTLVSVSGVTPTDHNSLTGRSTADSHPASAISFTPVGDLTSTDVAAAIVEAETKRYVADLSWAGGGPYTMSITGATHLRGNYPRVEVLQWVSGTLYEVVGIDSVQIDFSNGNVTLSINTTITGKVVII